MLILCQAMLGKWGILESDLLLELEADKSCPAPHPLAYHLQHAAAIELLARNNASRALKYCQCALKGKQKLMGRASPSYHKSLHLGWRILQSMGDSVRSEACRSLLPPHMWVDKIQTPAEYIRRAVLLYENTPAHLTNNSSLGILNLATPYVLILAVRQRYKYGAQFVYSYSRNGEPFSGPQYFSDWPGNEMPSGDPESSPSLPSDILPGKIRYDDEGAVVSWGHVKAASSTEHGSSTVEDALSLTNHFDMLQEDDLFAYPRSDARREKGVEGALAEILSYAYRSILAELEGPLSGDEPGRNAGLVTCQTVLVMPPSPDRYTFEFRTALEQSLSLTRDAAAHQPLASLNRTDMEARFLYSMEGVPEPAGDRQFAKGQRHLWFAGQDSSRVFLFSVQDTKPFRVGKPQAPSTACVQATQDKQTKIGC